MEDDKKKIDDFVNIDDEKFDNVSGGAWTATYTDEKYAAAGV